MLRFPLSPSYNKKTSFWAPQWSTSSADSVRPFVSDTTALEQKEMGCEDFWDDDSINWNLSLDWHW